jgi:hypothetical protein
MPHPSCFTPGKDPVPIVEEAGLAWGSVWTGAENLAHTGIRSPDCPAHSESLYRLSYPGPHGQEFALQMYVYNIGNRFKLHNSQKVYISMWFMWRICEQFLSRPGFVFAHWSCCPTGKRFKRLTGNERTCRHKGVRSFVSWRRRG